MNYNAATRNRISKIIIEKAKDLDSSYDNYKSRLNDTAEGICSPDKKDFQERALLLDYIDMYKNAFGELRYIDRYKYKDDLDATGAERKRSAVSYLDTVDINVENYIPYWSKFMESGYCGENSDIPMRIKDCKKIWEVFYQYYRTMPKDNIKKNSMWDVKPDEIRVTNEDDAVPYFPPARSFYDCIVRSIDESEDTMPVREALKELENFRKTFIKNGDFIRKNYLPIKYTMYSSEKEYDFINEFEIGRRYDSTSSTLRNGYQTTYSHSATVTSMEFGKEDRKPAEEIDSNFTEGEYLLLKGSGNNFAMANTTSKVIPVRTVKHESRPDPEGPIIFSYDYYYRSSISFSFFRRIGKEPMKIYNGDLYLVFKDILLYYLNIIERDLRGSYNAFKNSNPNIINEDGNPERNYNISINYISDYKKQLNNLNPSSGDSLAKRKEAVNLVNKIINTCSSTINSWLGKRENILFRSIKDDNLAESMGSILSNRMNKVSGSLFTWYSQEAMPMINDYIRVEEKLKNSLYIFKSGFLVKPDAGLDYKQEDNGGVDLIDPTFIDVPQNIYPYYRDAGVYGDFRNGDEIYIIDGQNPELKARIVSMSKWLALVGTSEDDNGNQIKQKEYVCRINLDRSIPSKVMKYQSLRIVKRI